MNSGSPGYDIGQPLLLGTSQEIDEISQTGESYQSGTYIDLDVGGFYLRGADQNGECYNIENAISLTKNASQYDQYVDTLIKT